jgi:hypothetical protein
MESSGTWLRIDWYEFTDVSKERTTSNSVSKNGPSRQQVQSTLHGVTSQKMWLFIVTAMMTSDPTAIKILTFEQARVLLYTPLTFWIINL